jgi:hypothetical protein
LVLGGEYAEWKPRLAAIDEVLREVIDPEWEEFVPDDIERID